MQVCLSTRLWPHKCHLVAECFHYLVWFLTPLSRLSCCITEWTLEDFVIGMYDVSPDKSPPTTDTIRVCARQMEPILPEGTTQAFHCLEEGQYVAVVMNGVHMTTLALCEVEVLGEIYGKCISLLKCSCFLSWLARGASSLCNVLRFTG